MMYSFEEIGLIPSRLSTIDHRKDTNPLIEGKLPIFVSPMTCILNSNNFDIFNESKFIPILPIAKERLHTLNLSEDWQALTLSDFGYFFNGGEAIKDFPYHILIDCANGHMKSIYDIVHEVKKEYPEIVIMIGNIANPETYIECCMAGIDYVRVGIGGGNGCSTSVQTGFHASMPWLLTTINYLKTNKLKDCKKLTKIIADGGIDSTSKIIKSLALGADYVMCGKMFAKCKEACGKISNTDMFNGVYNTYRHYYGQASECGQIDRFGEVKSHPEGIATEVLVDTDIKTLESKITAVLQSAMSYAGKTDISEFIGNVIWDIQSIAEFNSYIK